LTDAHKAAYASPVFADHVRVYIKDPDGVWVRLHDLQGYDWIDRVEYGPELDSPVDQLRLTLFRNVYQMNLAPLVQESRFNVDATGTFEPMLDLGKEVVVMTITGTEEDG